MSLLDEVFPISNSLKLFIFTVLDNPVYPMLPPFFLNENFHELFQFHVIWLMDEKAVTIQDPSKYLTISYIYKHSFIKIRHDIPLAIE